MKKFDERRYKELMELKGLLRKVSSLNNSTNIIENLTKVTKKADEFLANDEIWDTSGNDEYGLIRFLEKMAEEHAETT